MSVSKVYASEKELKKLSSYIIFDEETGDVKRVVFPNSMQIGLAAEPFSSARFVVSGTVESSSGFIGSLSNLVDGTSYLRAGTNVTITSGSTGQITISAAGGSGSPGGSDTQLQYNDGGSFGGISAFTWDDTDLTIGTTTKLEFRDAQIFLNSSVDGQLDIDADGEIEISTAKFDLDASSDFDIQGGAASSIATTAGDLTIEAGATSAKLVLKGDHESGTSIHIDGNAAAASLVDIDAGQLDIDASGAITIDSSGGQIQIGTNDVNQNISIGTDGTRTIQLGAGDGTTTTTVNSRGGPLTLNGAGQTVDLNSAALDIDASGAITIDGSSTISIDGGGALNIDTSSGALSVGTANSGIAVNIGHTTSETTINDNASVIGNLGVNGIVTGSMGLSGSLTRLADGTSYLAAGSNITITSASNGQVTIASSGGSGGISFDGSTENGMLTFKDSDEATVESNLRFNGSALHLTGALNVKYISTSDAQNGYSVAATDYIVGVNTSAGALTTTLPAAATAGAGRLLIIKDIGGYASASAKAINIATNGSEKIDGADSLQILVSSGTVSLFSDGSNWYVNGVA